MKNNMFVYFDEDGNIMSITPVANSKLEDLRSAEFAVDEVRPFLIGEKNIHRYAVVQDKETNNFKFVSKEAEKDEISTINRFLTEVTNEHHNDHDIMIEHDVRRKHLRVTMSGTGNSADTRMKKTLVANFRELTFYFTMFGDPNLLICKFDVPVAELKDGQVFVNLEHHGDELNNATLFTKKVLGKYHYRKLMYT
jgi:hypothetical protein